MALTATLALSLGGVAVVHGYHVKGYSVRSTTVALDVMQQLMTGDEEFFDPAYLEKLGQCWDDTHPELRQGRISTLIVTKPMYINRLRLH